MLTPLTYPAVQCFFGIIAVFALLYWILPRKLEWVSMLASTVLFAVLAFHVVPNESDDLVRYYMQLDYFREYGHDLLDRYIEEGFMEWDTYRVCAYYFYYISKLSSNSYLPAITIFIVYALSFLVIYKASRRFDVSKNDLFLSCLFFLSTYWYYDTCSGIRNGLVFSVIIACAYYHLVEKKNVILCYVGYALACFTHSAAIMPVALLALAVVTFKASGKVIKYGMVFGITIGAVLIPYLADVTSSEFLQTIADRAEDATDGAFKMTVNYAVNIVVVLVVVCVAFYYRHYIKNSRFAEDFSKLSKYYSFIICFAIGSVISSLVFLRFARWIIPVIGAVFFMVGRTAQNEIIREKGEVYLTYYSPLSDSLRIKTKSTVAALFVLFTIVHLFYLMCGSSLVWMQIE